MSGYSQGVRVEHAVIHHLTEQGYDCTRAASSKGAADVIASKPGQILLVNVKRTTPPGPAERAELLRIAAHLPGHMVPLVALKPAGQPLWFRRLTGPGPRDWVTWVADEVAAPLPAVDDVSGYVLPSYWHGTPVRVTTATDLSCLSCRLDGVSGAHRCEDAS